MSNRDRDRMYPYREKMMTKTRMLKIFTPFSMKPEAYRT